ncbi:hypothetical protein ACFX1T_034340 [Malus domestica]
MAPKITQTLSSCESGEGIDSLRCLLNSLHCPRAGLCSELFFKEGVHLLGPTWISQVPIAVETNMPKAD